MSKCKACGAPIKWIKTREGKNMPCDIKTVWFDIDPRGGQKIVTITGEVVRGKVVDKPDDTSNIGRISHFATCPQADMFRKRGRTDGNGERT